MSGSGNIGIFTVDRALVVQTWDHALERLTGINASRAVGHGVAAVVPDIETRGVLRRFEQVMTAGTPQVLAPALHHFLIPCPPRTPSSEFEWMQQRVTINPLREGEDVVGLAVVVEDVTERVAGERALARAAGSDDWRARQAAVEELAKTADESLILALLDNIKRNHRNFSLLSGALRLLATSELNVTRALVSLFDEEDADLRIQVALALGDQRDSEGIAALVRALDDPHVNVRFQAIESLGRLRAEAAVDKLLEIVASRDFYLSFAALDALTAINDPRVAPALVSLLDDPLLRVPIADALGALGDERAIPALVSALNATRREAASVVEAIVCIHDRFEREYQDGLQVSQQVRDALTDVGREHVLAAVSQASGDQLTAAVRMLGWLSGTEVARTLTALLVQPTVRNDVVEALVRHGDDVVDVLMEQLRSEDNEVRIAAISALGRVGSRRATHGLVGLLDEQREVVVAAAGALARIGDVAAFEPLLPLLDHEDASVRQSVIGALNSIGHPELAPRVRSLLRHSSPRVRESAVRIIGYFGYADALDEFIARASDPEEAVGRAVLEHLPFIEHQGAIPALLDALHADAPGVRATAARALGRVDDEVARRELRNALNDRDHWVRYYAARSLAQQRDAACAGALVQLAHHDQAMQVRIAAIDALGHLGAQSVVDELRRFSSSDRPEIAAAALASLGRLEIADVLPDLEAALRDSTSERRRAAITALAAHGSSGAASALAWAAAADAEPSVRDAAVDALKTIAATGSGGAEAVTGLLALLADSSTYERAAAALVQVPSSQLDAIARGLDHTDVNVRRGTIEVLGRIQRPEATRLVERAVDDPSPRVRAVAVETLARLGVRSAGDVIARLASQDPSKTVRRAAAAALARARGARQY